MTDRDEALQRLVKALNDFLESVCTSEGDDPDELDVEAVEKGEYLHNAVCDVQPFYGGKLPPLVAGNPWCDLQWVCRHETDPYKRQHDVRPHAVQLRDWAEAELDAERATVTPKRRGRKKADYVTEQREAELAAEWKRARENGDYKGDFARNRNMTIRDLNRLLGRVRKRKSRAD